MEHLNILTDLHSFGVGKTYSDWSVAIQPLKMLCHRELCWTEIRHHVDMQNSWGRSRKPALVQRSWLGGDWYVVPSALFGQCLATVEWTTFSNKTSQTNVLKLWKITTGRIKLFYRLKNRKQCFQMNHTRQLVSPYRKKKFVIVRELINKGDPDKNCVLLSWIWLYLYHLSGVYKVTFSRHSPQECHITFVITSNGVTFVTTSTNTLSECALLDYSFHFLNSV